MCRIDASKSFTFFIVLQICIQSQDFTWRYNFWHQHYVNKFTSSNVHAVHKRQIHPPNTTTDANEKRGILLLTLLAASQLSENDSRTQLLKSNTSLSFYLLLENLIHEEVRKTKPKMTRSKHIKKAQKSKTKSNLLNKI